MASLLERVSVSVSQAKALGSPSDRRTFRSLE